MKKKSWEHTRDNMPGHDGCLCIFFDGQNIEWWMEAKYSITSNNLSRGRLDPTIIEVILNRKVSRLFVVTNCHISSKIKDNIVTLIKQNSKCKRIDFITKYVLEKWLIENHNIYKKYFNNPIPREELEISSDLFIVDNIEIYDSLDSKRLCYEPLHTIFTGKIYHVYFSIYSDREREIKVSSSFCNFEKSCRIIKLNKGNITDCHLIFKASKKEQKNVFFNLVLQNKNENLKKIIKTEYKINILKQNNNVLTLAQNNNLELIKKRILHPSKEFQLLCLSGESGTGKTYLINRIPDIIDDNYMIESVTFVGEPYANAKLLLRSILYIFFPFIYEDEFSDEIKDVIKKNYKSGVFLNKLADIESFEKDYEEFCNVFREAAGYSYLFPPTKFTERKYIIWDDFSKLDEGLKRFAYNFIKQLKNNNDNICFIIVHNNIPIEMDSLLTAKYHFIFSGKDVNKILSANLGENIVNKYLTDILITITLKDFIDEYELDLKDDKDFILNYKKFWDDDKGYSFIANKISKLNELERSVLNRIYYSYSGISKTDFSEKCSSDIDDVLLKLQKLKLIKKDHDHKYVHFHDIYLKSYKNKNRFNFDTLNILPAKRNEEILKVKLLDIHEDNVKEFLNDIISLIQKFKFSAVYFILEELYTYKETIIQQIGYDNFYHLEYYFIYADANVKISGISSYKQFEQLWDNLQNIEISSKNYFLKLITLYELSNAAYDNLDYKRCIKFEFESRKLINEIVNLGYTDYDDKDFVFYINQLKYISILAESEIGKANTQFKNLFDTLYEGNYRFLRSKCITLSDIHIFIQNFKPTLTNVTKELNYKYYIKADFDVYFLELISNSRNLKGWYEDLKCKRDKFNHVNRNYYILATFSIVSILLTYKQYEKAKEIITPFYVYDFDNPRKKAFSFELLAAIEIIDGNYFKAENYLKKQLEIFEVSDSYKSIVVHNLKLVENKKFDKFMFYFHENAFENNIFYLETRCFY